MWYSGEHKVHYDYPCTLTREVAESSAQGSSSPAGGGEKQTIATYNTDTVTIRATDHAKGVTAAEQWATRKSIDLATSLREAAEACRSANSVSAATGHAWATFPLDLWPSNADEINALGHWPSETPDSMQSKSGDDRESCLGVMYLPVHLSGHDSPRVIELAVCPESLSKVFEGSQ